VGLEGVWYALWVQVINLVLLREEASQPNRPEDRGTEDNAGEAWKWMPPGHDAARILQADGFRFMIA
jgi:hypothetical protein